MQTLEGLRRKAGKARELRSVVHTLKLLSSASLRQHERAARVLADWGRTLELGFQALLRQKPEGFLEPRPRRRARPRLAAVLLGSDQGMCGAFNERTGRRAAERLATLAPGAEVPVLAVGRRLARSLDVPFLRVEEVLPMPGSVAGVPEVVQELLWRIEAWQEAGRLDALLLVHHRRGRGTASAPEVRHVLPVPLRWLRALEKRPWPGPTLSAFTMGWERLYSSLVREWVFLSLFRSLVESLEAESASRLAATDRAERNVDELIEELDAGLRATRQTVITAELMDVISGFEAVTGRR